MPNYNYERSLLWCRNRRQMLLRDLDDLKSRKIRHFDLLDRKPVDVTQRWRLELEIELMRLEHQIVVYETMGTLSPFKIVTT